MSAAEKLVAVETNEAQSTELVVAIKKHAVLAGNFDQVRAHFVEQLKKYDVVVTIETLPEAKKLATELNKAATEVKARGKAVSSEASAPINEFNEQVKELAQLLLDARLKLTEQVKTFEDEVKQAAADALFAYLVEQGEALGIQPEFQRANIDGLANLSALTATGKLTTKTKAAIDERLNADLHMQTQTEMRLLKLENESYKAGLSAPLERRHVDPFLFADAGEYDMRLASLLEAEKQREVKAREAADERAERESKMKAVAEERAARAEADRKEAERIRAEQQIKHEAEMAELKAQQEKQLIEQQEQMRLAPQPAVSPISMGEVAIQHAIGDLYSPRTAVMHTCSFSEACLIAAGYDAEKVGIWTKASGKLPAAVLVKGAAVASVM